MLSMDFDPCVTCPALPESAACLSCTLYMDDGFDDDKEKPFGNIDIDGSPLTFDERCDIVRKTAITSEMTYEERLQAQRRRYGL